MTTDPEKIEAGAKALRELELAGRRTFGGYLKEWERVSNGVKIKWRKIALVLLKATPKVDAP